MDSGTGDAAVSRTSPVRAGWMGLWTGRAGRAVVAAGPGTGTMTWAGPWTDARRAMGRLWSSPRLVDIPDIWGKGGCPHAQVSSPVSA